MLRRTNCTERALQLSGSEKMWNSAPKADFNRTFMSSDASAGGRDLRIDSLRGLLLVFMAVDHIASDLQVMTNHIFGYVSAAEGFVFISGLVAGLVYTRRRRKLGPEIAQAGCRRRAWELYGYHLALFIFVWIWALVGRALEFDTLAGPAAEASSWKSLLAGVFVANQPPLLDILPMYCGFMLLLPALLAAFDRGLRGRVLFGSFGLWLLANAFLPQVPWTMGVIRTSSFNLLAWQLLFIAGAACGHAWASRERLVPAARVSLIAIAATICVICYIVRHAFIPPPIPRGSLDWLTNKNNLAPLRLLNTAALYYLIYAVAARFPSVVEWRPLAFIGQKALPVFSAHIVVVYILAAFPAVFTDVAAGRWIGTAIMLGTMTVVAATSPLRVRPARALVPQAA